MRLSRGRLEVVGDQIWLMGVLAERSDWSDMVIDQVVTQAG